MNIFGLLKMNARSSAGAGESAANGTAAQGEQGQTGGNYLKDIVPIRSGKEAIVVSAVYSAVDILSNSLAMMSVQFMQYNKQKDYYKEDTRTSYGRSLNYLLQVQPNSRQNAMQFWKEAWQDVYMRGNAIIWPLYDDSLEIVAFEKAGGGTTVTYDADRNVYTISDAGRGWYFTKPAKDIIHIKNTYTDANGMGVSTIKYAARSLSIIASGDRQTLENIAKGGRMKIVIMQPQKQSLGVGRYSKTEMQKTANKLNEDIYSQDVCFLNGEGELKQISLSSAEQQLLETRSWGVDEVARFFVVPRSILGATGDTSYKTPEASNTALLNRALAPRMRELEIELNAKLLGVDGFGRQKIHVCEHALFSLDTATRTAWNKGRLETGLATVDELRKEANMPKVGNGGDLYVSTNLAVAGSEKLTGGSSKGDVSTPTEAQAD